MTAPEWTTACPDWEKRIVSRRSIVPVKPLFKDVADDAIDVFGALRMVGADGNPLMREACLPWVTDLVAALFGSLNPDTGRRLITHYFLMVSKKNGKSLIGAGVMLTALIVNQRDSAEFIILSPTKESSDNAYRPIRDMIRADPELGARFREQEHVKTVTDLLNGATLKVVAADSATVTGKKATGVFVDELWEFGKHSKAASMLTEATGGLASRPEGFVFYCTTQSDAPPAGVFRDKLNYARKVRDGLVTDKRFLPVIYEFPKAMLDKGDFKDLRNAYVTNPNWGVSVDEDVIQQKYQEAQDAGEGAMQDLWSKHLNVEIGMNLRSDRWTGADFWEAQARPRFTLDELIERSEVITVGDDGGGLDDIHGFAALGRTPDGEYLLWTHGFLHPIAVERRKSLESTYAGFVRDGDLEMLDTLPDDVTRIASLVMRIYDSGKLASIGLDPEKSYKILNAALLAAGIPEDMIYAIPQGWRLVGAITLAERWLSSGQMVHGNQPLMNWCVSNAKIELHGNAVSITKQASGTAKIDNLMAMFDAVALMALNPESQGKSFWDK